MEIVELKAGNIKVYEAVFRQFYEPLCQHAYSILRNRDEAEDIVQKTFCKLWDLREKLEINISINSYLQKMVHNACLNQIKQTQRRAEHHEQIAYFRTTTVNSVEQSLAHKELSQQIDNAINTLPERCREVFLLSRMQHLSYLQIAQQMQISPNTVETQMVKALKTLRVKLKDYLN